MFLSIFTGYVKTHLQDLNFQGKFEFSMLKLYNERGCSISPFCLSLNHVSYFTKPKL